VEVIGSNPIAPTILFNSMGLADSRSVLRSLHGMQVRRAYDCVARVIPITGLHAECIGSIHDEARRYTHRRFTTRPHGNSTTVWLLYVTTFYYTLAIVRFRVCAYLRDMTKRNQPLDAAPKSNPLHSTVAAGTRKPTSLMRSMLCIAFAVLAMVTISTAAELPEAPSTVMGMSNAAIIEAAVPVQAPSSTVASPEIKVIDKTFVSLAFVSTGSTFADSYTTLFARQNWLAGKKGVCNVEVQSAYLYGTHPTVGRAYAVASVKSVGSVFAAYYLRKHHSKFWSVPLVANSVISLQGVGQNMATCN
jgi:hypothetical protein